MRRIGILKILRPSTDFLISHPAVPWRLLPVVPGGGGYKKNCRLGSTAPQQVVANDADTPPPPRCADRHVTTGDFHTLRTVTLRGLQHFVERGKRRDRGKM